MALWNKGNPKKTGEYCILLEDGEILKAHFFKCQLTGRMEWSREEGSYIYENIMGWMDNT